MSDRILTEEQINLRESKLNKVQMSSTHKTMLNEIIASHRELFKANAGLSFENLKYKQFLKKLQHEFYIAGDYNNLDKINTFMEEPK